MMSYPPSEATLANTTSLPVSDAVKFNMADRVHRLSLAASLILGALHATNTKLLLIFMRKYM